MYRISNFTDNDDIRVLDTLGPFSVIEYLRDFERDARQRPERLFLQ